MGPAVNQALRELATIDTNYRSSSRAKTSRQLRCSAIDAPTPTAPTRCVHSPNRRRRSRQRRQQSRPSLTPQSSQPPRPNRRMKTKSKRRSPRSDPLRRQSRRPTRRPLPRQAIRYLRPRSPTVPTTAVWRRRHNGLARRATSRPSRSCRPHSPVGIVLGGAGLAIVVAPVPRMHLVVASGRTQTTGVPSRRLPCWGAPLTAQSCPAPSHR
jgi:hypothetical protein